MKLNETLEVISYNADVTSLDFILNATKADVLAATEGRDLELKAGTVTVGLWKGWTVTGVVDCVSNSGDGSSVTYTRLTAARALDPQTAESIKALETNVAVAKSAADAAKRDAATAQTAANKAQQTADKAIEGGANPELATFATMQLISLAPTMSDADVLSISSLFPEWKVGAEYEAKQVIRYEGELYRIAQKHTAQEQWKPGSGTESLYTHITQSGGYDVWQQPTGGHDAYSKGTRVWYPTANSTLYESLIDANTYSPEAYPAGWKRVTE